MNLDAAQTVSETHPRKSSWSKALLLLLSTPFLIFFALNLLKHAPNPPGFTVGAPLAPGKVAPQLSYNYFNTIVSLRPMARCGVGNLREARTLPTTLRNKSALIPTGARSQLSFQIHSP